jgi:hypothetical protein
MLSLLLITALAVQYPPPAPKPATDTSATRRPAAAQRSTQAAPRDTSRAAAVGRMAFHDRMRELWSDHVTYTRNFIISASAGLGDTAEVTQRLLRNQDELGDAIKPYYGDAAGSQLTSLLRSHIQLAGKTLVAAKGQQPTQVGMNMSMQDNSGQYLSQQNTTADTTQIKSNSQYPTAQGRLNDTSKVGQNREFAQAGQTGQAQVDSTALQTAITALRANGDSIATLLSSANPRGFAKETLKGAIQMHINLLLQEATAHLKKDWSGSIAAFDESQRQASQMADMLSEGIMKQFPNRFNNKATTVSSR